MATLMPSRAVDTFTGSNGAAWNSSNWYTAFSQNSGYSRLLNNRGIMVTGSTRYSRISMAVNIAARADAEAVFDWIIPADGDAYPRFLARSENNLLNTFTAYYFTLEANRMEVGRYNSSYGGTTLNQTPHPGTTPGQIMRSRIAVFGNRLKARTWIAGTAEPTSVWQINIYDSVISGAGYFGFTQANDVSGSRTFEIDNFDLLDSEMSQLKKILLESWISPQGAYIKKVPKSFAASVAPSGYLGVNRVVLRFFNGSIGAGGVSLTLPSKIFNGSIRPSASYSRMPRKVLGGDIDIGATLSRRVSIILGGEIETSGTSWFRNAGRIFGQPGIVVAKILKAGHVRARVRKG